MKVLSVLVSVIIATSSVGAATIWADADGFENGTNISTVFAGVTLSSVGGYPGLDGSVYSWWDSRASTGTKVFDNNLLSPFEQQWMIDETIGFAFRADFEMSAKSVTIDIIGNDSSGDTGALYAYNL